MLWRRTIISSTQTTIRTIITCGWQQIQSLIMWVCAVESPRRQHQRWKQRPCRNRWSCCTRKNMPKTCIGVIQLTWSWTSIGWVTHEPHDIGYLQLREGIRIRLFLDVLKGRFVGAGSTSTEDGAWSCMTITIVEIMMIMMRGECCGWRVLP